MATESERALSAARKRRGIAKASITRLATRAAELERKPELTAEDGSMAQNLMKRLDSLNAEFMSHHLAIVDLLEEDAAEGQQAVLDENDDRVSALIVRMQCLCNRAAASLTRSTGSNPTELISKRLQHLEKEMHTVGDTMLSPKWTLVYFNSLRKHLVSSRASSLMSRDRYSPLTETEVTCLNITLV
jgi:hypothetical protein